MTNKEMLSHTIPVIHEAVAEQPAVKSPIRLPSPLKKFMAWLKGEENKTFTPDPAVKIIAQIENEEVAIIVRDLHYKTPKSLQAMRKICEECFILPDDCPHYDYSTFDVKKATKRLVAQPKHTHNKVVEELQKINHELAYHLNEYLEETQGF
jgi:hypothetical protein